MAGVVRGGQRYELRGGESVLDGLIRHGVPVSSSCRAGHCRSCLLRAENPPEEAQSGLKQTLRERGHFLACLCVPTADLILIDDDASLHTRAEIIARRVLAPDIVRLWLRPEQPLDFVPGQFVTLQRDDGLTRSYSLASLPREGWLELHIRRVAGGQMSRWLHDEVEIGTEVTLAGPFGDCYYARGRPTQPLLLAGVGTGLAPLYGIVRDALEHGHDGPVTLWQAALRPDRLYYEEELRSLTSRWPNLTYRACTREGHAARPDVVIGSLPEVMLGDLSDCAAIRAFLCGDPTLVHQLKKRLFLAGVPLGEIHADAFVPSSSPATRQ